MPSDAYNTGRYEFSRGPNGALFGDGYRHRINEKLTARFQLNISNLLDSDKLQYRNFGTYRPGNIASNPLIQIPNQITIPDPRKFTLSATFDF
ncbi:MAG: hypothetical protein Q7S40_29730 [Opitutaceae bacterium]|nr:hypothetical protein [Opitutaceae bacterium]